MEHLTQFSNVLSGISIGLLIVGFIIVLSMFIVWIQDFRKAQRLKSEEEVSPDVKPSPTEYS